MKLYGYWRSSAAYRVRIALHLKGLSAEHQSVHLVRDGGEQHQAAYSALNPQELVPTLLLMDGAEETALSQSLAIIEYLDERYPTPALLPQAALARAQVRAMALSIACDIHPLNNLRVLQYLTNTLGVDEQAKNAWYHHWITTGFAPLETELARHSGRYCFGDTVTLADVCLV
ncbi:MAG: maleylacetoacetate isomerase, partial [Shewanella sp.]